jgi:three-Cys-motif partner protein
MPTQEFFNESAEQSRIKASIIAEYFFTWAKVIMPTAKAKSGRIAYIDLFAGPGRYQDGTRSTPLLVIERAIKDPEMCKMLVSHFNDADSDNSRSLETAINELPNIGALKFKPRVSNAEVTDQLAAQLEEMKLIPTFSFVDPFGYKGLSLRLVNSVIKDWGCDCVFFFNYNRINAGIGNNKVESHINALFSQERADRLRSRLVGLSPEDREATILEELVLALKDMGGQYVLPFRFKKTDKDRTSHHLIFVSKHFKGYEIMKEIMARRSSSSDEGVSSFEYNPATARQPFLFGFLRPLSELKKMLLRDFAGRTLTMRQIYEQHSVDTPYIAKNYKEALRQLEAEGRIKADPQKRPVRNGEVTFGDKVVVTFD